MRKWRLVLRRRRDERGKAAQARRTNEAVRALIDAAESASASGIAALLSERATFTIDGGVHLAASSASSPVETGLELLSLLDTFPDRTLVQREVNGAAGIVIRSSDRVVGVLCIAMQAGKITHIWVVINPDKLAHWNRP